MCGIAGLMFTEGAAAERAVRPAEALSRMLGRLQHRGPDDEGRLDFEGRTVHVSLGHTRLSILDLTVAGRQPMRDPQTENCITFNGEVYNFRELRRELAGDGWETQTDTEVILRAYDRWGVEAFRRL